MGIETRGQYSARFPKHSYRIELSKDSLLTEERNLSLTGMQADGDWNLLAMYNEPMRLNSMAASLLWRRLGHEGPRLEYVEVFRAGHYEGLYALTRRVDAKLLGLEAGGGELYKAAGRGTTDYAELPAYDNAVSQWGGFEAIYPANVDWEPLYAYVSFVMWSPADSLYGHYGEWVDSLVLADYYLFLNLLKMADNTGKNIFIVRPGPGKPYTFFPWDMDGSFGNYWDGSFRDSTAGIHSNGLYERLLADEEGFGALLRKRWQELGQGALGLETMEQSLDSLHALLRDNGNYEREALAWPGSVDGSLSPALDWLRRRWAYWDGYMKDSSLYGRYLAEQVWE